MKSNASSVLAFGALLLFAGVAAGEESNTVSQGVQATVDGLLDPFWRSETMRAEGLFFGMHTNDVEPIAMLAFPPKSILAVKSASGQTNYMEGRDYTIDRTTGVMHVPAGSHIPVKTAAEMYPPAQSNLPRIGTKRGDPGTYLIWSEGHYFHDMQVEVTYTHAAGLWKGPVPVFADKALARTIQKLRHHEPIKLCLVGDSISQGYNASGYIKVAPFMPPYGQLVALGLERAYGSKVDFKNFGVAGWGVGNGLADTNRPIAEQPDLVIVAFGMNDSGKIPTQFAAEIGQLVAKIQAGSPRTEFVLVASMMPNAEWAAVHPENIPRFRDELAKLCGPGVALADVTGVWIELLKRKRWHDLTGNGVNHPNDFGHRLYAQMILGLLVDPGLKLKAP